MKTLTLVLALVFSFVCLAAVESDDSNICGFIKQHCVPGLNFFGLALEQGYAMASDFAADYPGMIDAMSYWSVPSQTWVSAIDLGYWDGDYPIQPYAAVMFNSLADFYVYSIGDLVVPDPTRQLWCPGLNDYVFYQDAPPPPPLWDWVSGLGDATGFIDAISKWDQYTQSWVSTINLGGYWDGDFAAYWTLSVLCNTNLTECVEWP